MFKRITWFTVGVTTGAAAGALGAAVVYVRARDIARERVPDSVQDAAGRVVRATDAGVRTAIVRTADRVGEWRTTADETRRTRREAEDMLLRQLERSGL